MNTDEMCELIAISLGRHPRKEEIIAALRERDALRADAKRYRWIRKGWWSDAFWNGEGNPKQLKFPDLCDSIVDAAIAAEEGGE